MLINLFLACVFVLFPAPDRPEAHEFHASKCLIEYKASEKTLEISLHLFVDDVEEALRRKGADQLFLCTEKESSQATTYLERYLRQGLQLQLDGRDCSLRFVGKEPSEDWQGMWCYAEVTEVPVFKELVLNNTLLTEVFSDQKNLVNVVGPKQKKNSLLFHAQKTRQTLTF